MEEETQIKKLETILDLIEDDKAKSDDVAEALAAVLEVVRKMKEDLVSKMASNKDEMTDRVTYVTSQISKIEQKMSDMQSKLSLKMGVDKSEMMEYCKTEMEKLQDMMPEMPDLSPLERRIGEVEAKIPKIPDEITPDKIANKLNELEEAVDIEVIKGLKKKLEDLEKKWVSRPIFGGGGFSVGAMNFHFLDPYTPTGTVNGVNTDFVLSHIPSPAASLEVYLNGQLQDLTNDYTLSGTTVSFVSAPLTGDKVRVKHRI